MKILIMILLMLSSTAHASYGKAIVGGAVAGAVAGVIAKPSETSQNKQQLTEKLTEIPIGHSVIKCITYQTGLCDEKFTIFKYAGNKGWKKVHRVWFDKNMDIIAEVSM